MKNNPWRKSIYLILLILTYSGGMTLVYSAGNIVAKVGGETITKSELLFEMSLPTSVVDTIRLDPITAKQTILNNMIDKKILSLEAAAQKINVDPKVVEEYYQNEVLGAGGDEKFKKRLKLQGINDKQFRQQLADLIRVRTLLQTNVYLFLKPITFAEAQTYYDTHRSEFTIGDQVWFRYIYISISQESTTEGKVRKLMKAQQALEKIKNGEDFAIVAQDFSESDRASFGGDVGQFIHRGELPNLPEVEQMAFSLDSGKFSNIIQTLYGYYIVKVEQKENGQLRNFEKVKLDILEKLNKKQAEDRYNEWFTKIKAKYPAEIFPENF